MYNHEPENYTCPICIAVQGIENDDTLIAQSDIIYRDDSVMAFISSFFIGKNPGHIIVVSNNHYENIYDFPEDVGHRIFDVAKKMANVLKKAYNCDGITILQNNEPAGNQHAFHYHFHVFPRYENDELHKNMLDKKSTTADERKEYSEKVLHILNKA